MKKLSLKQHLKIRPDIEPTTSSNFKLDDYISSFLSNSEAANWGYVRTDWTLVDDAALRLALMLGNSLRYDDIPLYIHCLKSGVRSHNLAITSHKKDRERLICFAEGLVEPIVSNLITIYKSSGEKYTVPNGRAFLDDKFCGRNDVYKIDVDNNPIVNCQETRLKLIGLVFEDNDHFDIVDVMMQSAEAAT